MKKYGLILITMLLMTEVAEASKLHSNNPPIIVSSLEDSGPGTLRQAILDAAVSPGVDKIIFKVSGTILLTSDQLTITSDLIIDSYHRNIEVNGGNQFSVFVVNSGITVELDNLTITGGFPRGIYNDISTLTLNNSIVRDNGGGDAGGGIYNKGTLTLNVSTIKNNKIPNGGGCMSGGSGAGGGIYNDGGVVTLNKSSVNHNYAVDGGGINNGGTVTLNKSLVEGNTGFNGGGIATSGQLNLFKSIVRHNESTICDNSWGGGIFQSSGSVVLDKSRIENNFASDGDAIFVIGEGDVTIKKSIIKGCIYGYLNEPVDITIYKSKIEGC